MSERETEQPVAVEREVATALMKTCYDEANRIANHCSDGAAKMAMHYLYEAANEAKARLAAAADDSAKAPLADRTAFASSDWLDLLAVGWEAEAELIEGRLAHDPFRKRPENISCEEGERMRVEINRLRVCALELREWLVGLASKSNDPSSPTRGGK